MFSKNIKYLRTQRNMLQSDLAEALGYKSKATICRWENGETYPRARQQEQLSKLFDVSIDDLMHADLQRPTKAPSAVRIPILGRVPAGIPIEAITDVEGWEEIPQAMTTGGREYFALRVTGDSMIPKYVDGDIIIVRIQPDCDSGQDCVAYVNGYDATLKRIIKREGLVILQPINPKYEPLIYAADDPVNPVTIAGVVVEIRRKV